MAMWYNLMFCVKIPGLFSCKYTLPNVRHSISIRSCFYITWTFMVKQQKHKVSNIRRHVPQSPPRDWNYFRRLWSDNNLGFHLPSSGSVLVIVKQHLRYQEQPVCSYNSVQYGTLSLYIWFKHVLLEKSDITIDLPVLVQMSQTENNRPIRHADLSKTGLKYKCHK